MAAGHISAYFEGGVCNVNSSGPVFENAVRRDGGAAVEEAGKVLDNGLLRLEDSETTD